MKKLFISFLIAACPGIAVLAQDNNPTPYLTKSLAGNATIYSVVVNTSEGGISVSGQSGQTPRIEVYIKGNNGRNLSKEEIKKRLGEDYDMNIAVNGHELDAIVKNKHDNNGGKEGLSISFKIYVPEQVSTNLQTSGGAISLNNLRGRENLTTSGGSLHLDALNGTIRGKTSGGNIDVSNSAFDIDLQTSSGRIAAKNCIGIIKLETSGGGLVLENLKGKIAAQANGGGIAGKHIEGELTTGTPGGSINLKDLYCNLDATTSAGSLNIQMTSVRNYVKLNAGSGNIRLQLPSAQSLNLDLTAQRINGVKPKSFRGAWSRKDVKGVVNFGGGVVVAHSNDNLDVRFD